MKKINHPISGIKEFVKLSDINFDEFKSIGIRKFDDISGRIAILSSQKEQGYILVGMGDDSDSLFLRLAHTAHEMLPAMIEFTNLAARSRAERVDEGPIRVTRLTSYDQVPEILKTVFTPEMFKVPMEEKKLDTKKTIPFKKSVIISSVFGCLQTRLSKKRTQERRHDPHKGKCHTKTTKNNFWYQGKK